MKKEKLFRLKKDIIHPDVNVNAGVIKTAEEWKYFKGDKNCGVVVNYTTEENILDMYPEWFEEVEEPEFTKSDMIDFANYHYQTPFPTEIDLKDWLQRQTKSK